MVLERVVQREIKSPLADELLFGDLAKGGSVKITVGENGKGKKELKFKVTAADQSKPREKEIVKT